MLLPEFIDEVVQRRELVGVQQEQGQHGTQLGGAEHDAALVHHHLQRPKNPKLHGL